MCPKMYTCNKNKNFLKWIMKHNHYRLINQRLLKNLNLQTMSLTNLESSHLVFFPNFWLDYINFKTISKMINFTKTSLGVKPPLKISMFRHNVKFSRSGVFMGGWTLVPISKMQPSFHQGLPAKGVWSFIVVRKS